VHPALATTKRTFYIAFLTGEPYTAAVAEKYYQSDALIHEEDEADPDVDN